jgi:alpha-L-fucosidase 2
LGWKINISARFKEGYHLDQLKRVLLSPWKGGAGGYPNLFDTHPLFQIDGDIGGADGVGEFLVKCHIGLIELLPAVPWVLEEERVYV